MNKSRREFLMQSALLSVAGSMAGPETILGQAKVKPSELAKYDGLGLAELVRKKQVSPLELVEDVIRRVERVNPKINAVLTELYDVEKARSRARKASTDGMFAGVPVMLKNLTWYMDAEIDFGSRLYARYRQKNGKPYTQNSSLVNAMEASGMTITGITNSPELGLIDTTEPILHGATHNPWNLAYTPGGSSGGTGAAVAAGIIPLAHGNDGGGSIRIPASQCGVFGLKPTRSRELGNGTRRQVVHESINISSDLCLSRSVRDTAGFLSIGENKDDPNLPPVGFISGPSKKRLRIGLMINGYNGAKPHPEVEKAVKSTAGLCDKLGHHVEEATLRIDGEKFTSAFLGLWAAGAAGLEPQIQAWLGKDVKREEVLEPWTIGLIDLAKSRGLESCIQTAIKVFTEVTSNVESFFRKYDVLLTPVLGVPPYKLGWHTPTLEFNTLMTRVMSEVGYTPIHNAAGTTAMSVPLNWTPDGLPIGSQFAAWRGGEATLLHLAYELEAARPWAGRRPPVSA